MEINCKLSKPQGEFMRRQADPLVIMQCGVGSGKTYIASIYLITHMLQGRRLVAGALNHGALMKTLFRQTFDLAWKWGLNPQINKQDKTLSVGSGITFGYSNDAPDSVLGLSDIYALVLDEAARCSELFFNNLSDRLRGAGVDEPMKRLITSPCIEANSAWYNDLCKSHPEDRIQASLLSNPFVSPKYIAELTERYGLGSNLYRQQVLGETVETDFLNAILKDDEIGPGGRSIDLGGPWYMGMDLAGLGRDSNCLMVINEHGLVRQELEQSLDTMGKSALLLDSRENTPWTVGALDTTGGYGDGVYDAVKHIPRLNVVRVTFGEKPEKDIYRNVRSEMYMELAAEIRNGFYVDRTRYPELVEELRHTKVYIDERGKLRIIPKEDIKREIGRSPDRADALALAVYAKNHQASRVSAQASINTVYNLINKGYL